MGYKFNPFTGNLDEVGAGGGGATSPGGSTTQVQFNDAGSFGGDVDLTWNKTTNLLTVAGDVNLSDGGTYTTTLQTITPTANRTISLPDATGTVALVGGSSGQLVYNNAGANAGASTLTYDGSILTTSGRFINSYNATASAPAKAFTGTWFTGGTSTTTKPQVLIEPTGTTSTAWSTSGTGLGVNAASGFTGNLLDLQVNGSSAASITSTAARFGTTNNNVRLGSFSSISTVNWYFQDSLRGQITAGLGSGHDMIITAGTPGGASGTLTLTASNVKVGSFELTDGNVILGTTTGTKIGTATTQKLGFYNKTPVVQPAAVADATDAATAITQLNALLARMRDLGLIAT